MIEVNGQKVKASPVVTEHGRNFITVVVGSGVLISRVIMRSGW